MSWWQVDTETIAGARFVISARAETTGALLRLHKDVYGGGFRPGEREFLDAHQDAYHRMLDGSPALRLVLATALRPGWLADFVAPPQAETERPLAEELDAIRGYPDNRARDDLARALALTGGPALPDEIHRVSPGPVVADALEWVWETAIAPDWSRRRRILEADVVARTRQLTQGGWVAAFSDLKEGMRWLGGGRLQVNLVPYQPRDVSGTQLMFVPITTGRGWVSWDEQDRSRHAIAYPASAPLAASGSARPVPDALGRLLGPVRARVLTLLDTPKSTSQLCAVTGLALGSVGRHLGILLDAGLVLRRRAGRAVLYSLTDAGRTLITASQP
ncbi:ArsR/SmtB family transcription factor [Catenuloplanes japonicus]|uniref:ArsR/SmtB family transcription factor n=1 Tax=Catenuloplanes japonicus TaxID=33876 RepID=UPI000525511B|nr:winged helix-turn-helix domain-containing protein [Catenuloplanes japonicus]